MPRAARTRLGSHDCDASSISRMGGANPIHNEHQRRLALFNEQAEILLDSRFASNDVRFRRRPDFSLGEGRVARG
jgi:hypothetical protein